MSNGNLHLCLAQLRRSTDAEMLNDSSRAHSVAAIRALLTDPRSLNDHQLDGGVCPRLIVAPELSIGSGDWADVDAILRSSRADTILIIGCGFVQGMWINNWLQDHAGPTARIQGWPAGGQAIAACRPYNIGFAWIKTAAGCQCVLFLKNFPDQSAELPAVPNLDQGRWLVRLDADDLVVFPMICSDLLAQIEGNGNPGSAAERIRRSLDANPTTGQQVLITGSLLAPKPGHGLWNRALVHCSEKVGQGHVLALSNAATDVRQTDRLYCGANAEEEGWRNRTGVFKPTPIPAERDLLPGRLTVLVQRDNFVAAVARETFALIQGGPVRWKGSVVSGAYLWHPTARLVLDASGSIATIGAEDPLAHEVVRQAIQLRNRLTPNAADAASTDASTRAMHSTQCFRFDAAKELATALSDPAAQWPDPLANTIIAGLDAKLLDLRAFTDDPSGWSHISFLQDGLEAAAVVRYAGAQAWQTIPDLHNRVMQCESSQGIAVWSTPFHTVHEMERAISTWVGRSADACRLVVVGQSKNHAFSSGQLSSTLPREDIGQPEPTGPERLITTTRLNRSVTLVPLPRLREACEPAPPGDTRTVRDRARDALGLIAAPMGAFA